MYIAKVSMVVVIDPHTGWGTFKEEDDDEQLRSNFETVVHSFENDYHGNVIVKPLTVLDLRVEEVDVSLEALDS